MFQYEPIDRTFDSLRLLSVLPRRNYETGSRNKSLQEGNADQMNEICCELKHRTFASKPAYEALSYTWGEGPASKEIQVNGRPFFVRENLYDALHNLRFYTGTRTIWVDAVCINQTDVHERNYQVSLMAFIYTRAKRVLVWLGLRPYKLEHVDILKSRLPGVVHISDDQGTRDKRVILGRKNSLALANNPYWTRLWIIQEVVLAQDIQFHFGDHQLSWEAFSDRYNQASNEIVKAASPIIDQRTQRHTDALLLETIMETFQEAQCTEPRDKVFGFLGIAHDCADDMIKIDYEMGYVDLYARVLEFQQSRTPISTSGLSPEIDRLARLMKFSQLVQKVLGGMVDHEMKTRDSFKGPMGYYKARGVLAGEILHLGHTYSEVVSSSNANKEWKKAIEHHYGKNEAELFTLRENDTAYSRTILDWDETYLEKIQDIGMRTNFGYQSELSGEIGAYKRSPTPTSEIEEPRRFLGTLGLIGFVPPQAEVGDLICRFWGCDLAIVLRKPVYPWHVVVVGRADVGPRETSAEQKDMVAISTFYEERDNGLALDIGNVVHLELDIHTLQKLTK